MHVPYLLSRYINDPIKLSLFLNVDEIFEKRMLDILSSDHDAKFISELISKKEIDNCYPFFKKYYTQIAIFKNEKLCCDIIKLLILNKQWKVAKLLVLKKNWAKKIWHIFLIMWLKSENSLDLPKIFEQILKISSIHNAPESQRLFFLQSNGYSEIIWKHEPLWYIYGDKIMFTSTEALSLIAFALTEYDTCNFELFLDNIVSYLPFKDENHPVIPSEFFYMNPSIFQEYVKDYKRFGNFYDLIITDYKTEDDYIPPWKPFLFFLKKYNIRSPTIYYSQYDNNDILSSIDEEYYTSSGPEKKDIKRIRYALEYI